MNKYRILTAILGLIVIQPALSAQAINADSVTANPGNDLVLSAGTGSNLVVASMQDMVVNGVTVGVGANGASLVDNTVLGSGALGNPANTSRFSVAIGYNALSSIGSTYSGNHVAIGHEAMKSFNGVGNSNVAIGRGVMRLKTSGGNNTAVSGLNGDLTGTDNAAFGTAALGESTADSKNSAFGRLALRHNNGGTDNTGVGYQSGQANITGSRNLFIGANAGAYETGSNAVYINSIDRVNTARDKSESIIYGVQDSNPLLQTLALNAAVTATGKLATTKFFEITEQTVWPANPAANNCRIYSKKVGGKTVIYALFPSGVEVPIVVEP